MAARATAKVSFQSTAHMAKVKGVVGRRMVRAERHVRARWMLVTSRPFPPASRPGQWPRRRTGRLQRGIRANINATTNGVRLSVTNVAVSPRGFRYPQHLEQNMRRHGLQRLLATTWRTVGRILAKGR